MKKANIPTKYRSTKFYNSKSREIIYGVQAKVNGKWHNCIIAADDCESNFFDTQLEAVMKVRELNNKLKQQ